MALQGKTKIELTDVKTGKKEIIEKHNFITNGVHTLMDSMGGLWANTQMYYNEMWNLLFGSVLLFDSPIEGDETTIFPANDNIMIGGAEYNYTNTKTDAYLGSYNGLESVIDTENKTVTMVFDFATNQCNGNIGAICLAPVHCARAAVFGVSSRIEAWDNNFGGGASITGTACANYMEDLKVNAGGVTFLQTFNDMKSPQYQRLAGNQYTTLFDKTYRKLSPIVFNLNENYGYYFNINDNSVCKVGLNIGRVSIFQKGKNWNATILETNSISFPTEITICGDKYVGLYDDTHFWVFGYDSANSTSSNIYMYVVEFDTGNITKTVTVQPLVAGFIPSDFQMYYTSGYMIFTAYKSVSGKMTYTARRVKENNPTDISIPTGVTLASNSTCVTDGYASIYPKFDINGRVYMADGFSSIGTMSSVYPMLVWDVISNKTYYRTGYFGDGDENGVYLYRGSYARDIENPLLLIYRKGSITEEIGRDGEFGTRSSAFLSTINNLDEVVTKTSDKTMKITYTLQEVAE